MEVIVMYRPLDFVCSSSLNTETLMWAMDGAGGEDQSTEYTEAHEAQYVFASLT